MDSGTENNQIEEPESKKQKLSNSDEKTRKTFEGAKVVSILNNKTTQKCLFLHGKFEDDKEKDAVFILERKPFDTKTEALQELLSDKTKLTSDLKNDIYSTFSALPSVQNDIKATIIYPASEKHLRKYRKQDIFVVKETKEDYNMITKPYVEQQFVDKIFNIQWVYNILDHKAEMERIIFEDQNEETGFVLLPDMKWDTKDADSFYAIALPRKRGLKSLRDLDESHVEMLKNMRSKSLAVIADKFGIKQDRLRMYFHYQPSFYHLHVHINHIELDLPGTGALRAHLLDDVIENLLMQGDYYQRKTVSMTLQDSDKLLAAFRAKENNVSDV
uniref:m7GpppX diphosphatase n=1 Tax=Phallusia mammillata TaxID=59560 RepID=A0A6F9DBF3_9ASCI|nr:m7GpppX diphosphatase-like [Phallusia mammillata]